jgi:hypothetical protein
MIETPMEHFVFDEHQADAGAAGARGLRGIK